MRLMPGHTHRIEISGDGAGGKCLLLPGLGSGTQPHNGTAQGQARLYSLIGSSWREEFGSREGERSLMVSKFI